jgi:hypothetical protein
MLFQTGSNAGTVNFSPSIGINVYNDGISTAGVVVNQTGALFDIQSDAHISDIGASTFYNAGTLRKTAGTGIPTISLRFANSRTVDVQTGTLSFTGGGTLGGTFTTAAGAALTLAGGDFVTSGTPVFSGLGSALTGGTLTLTSVAPANLLVNGGIVYRANSLGLPAFPGTGVAIEVFNGVGGGAVPTPASIAGLRPDGSTLSPRVDFPASPATDIGVGGSFSSFFAPTTIPPDPVKNLAALNFTLRVEGYLRVSRDLDLDTTSSPIDLQLGVGSDDGFYLIVGTNVLGSAADRGFGYTWMPAQFAEEGLYPFTLLYAANAVGFSGLKLAWRTASGEQIIPQSALYLTPDVEDRLITFEELPVGTVLSNQFSGLGIIFTNVSGGVAITTNFPAKFVPISPSAVLADPRTNPVQSGVIDLTFKIPGTGAPAITKYVSFFIIDAETTGASVVAFDSDGQVVFTNSYHGGGAAQELVAISNPRIARVRLSLGSGSDTAAVDNLAFSAPTIMNRSPALEAITNRTVDEGGTLVFAAAASDPDAGQTVTYALENGAPAGAVIDSTSGQFSWTPTEDQGPGTYTIGIRVTDNGFPALSSRTEFTVTVNEVNRAPQLGSVGAKYSPAGRTLTFSVSATDPDLPAQILTFSLDPGAPSGATIDPQSGAFSWDVPAGFTSGVYPVTVRVTDNGTPAKDATTTFSITVDSAGPKVTAATPSGDVFQAVDFVDLTFDKAIRSSSVTPAVVILTGPGGVVGITNVQVLAPEKFRLQFPVQSAAGSYTLRVGPSILDLAGNPMNQDGDAINGEPVEDQYLLQFAVRLPDLFVTEARHMGTVGLGQPFTIAWTTTNAGVQSAAAPWQYSLALATTSAAPNSRGCRPR